MKIVSNLYITGTVYRVSIVFKRVNDWVNGPTMSEASDEIRVLQFKMWHDHDLRTVLRRHDFAMVRLFVQR
jgi:hypothetical protein